MFSFVSYVTLIHHFSVFRKNIFIIQLFLIIWVSGSLFKLCLKGSTTMYLLHVLKILWVLVKNVHRKIKCFREQFWCQEKARMQDFATFTPDPRNTTSLCEVGDSLHQSFNSPMTFVFSPKTQRINDFPVNYIPKYLQIFHLLVK